MSMIAPLVWEVSGRWETARTCFGTYQVWKSGDEWRWGYCFDEYHDEDDFSCDSLEEGKQLAWVNWCERLAKCLTPEAWALCAHQIPEVA
ncbi:hypothetical protein [Ancylobacter rudongensis]|uniref:Uncharacterized protein n=1 Tax=Ancylobacter rudongensis TaxID=177413 RepID=A0A1G4UQB7_9HYPH|nr:hypothetical protein [Ancylobacter rudongensis]SCW95833.1 hypothetical protein SAMN05660859_0129 [Ancylobacter rudongensis]